MASTEIVEKVAKAAFFQAIDVSACALLLSIPNSQETTSRLKAKGADRAADIVQLALFHRLLLWSVVGFDHIRAGDFHLKVGIEALSDEATFEEVASRGDAEALRKAVNLFREAEASEELKRLRHLRNKEGAHTSELDQDIGRGTKGEVLAFSEKMSTIAEFFAHGTGVVTLTLASQVQSHSESAEAFWRPWLDPD